jgi:hypothetical protein
MKKLWLLIVGVAGLISPTLVNGQATQANNVRTPAAFVGWNGLGPNAGPLEIRNDFNQPILFATNNFNRMIIDNGAGFGNAGLNGGRISIGNNLPNNFAPQSRVHIHQTGGGPFSTNNTYVRFTNALTGATATDGFAIGNSSGLFTPQGDVQLQQFEQAPIILQAPNSNTNSPNLLPYEWFRLQNNVIYQPNPLMWPRRTDGYIGLNQPAPRSHIEMITPAFPGGEEFFMAKPSDLPSANVQMGLMNFSGTDNFFLPGFFGNLNQANQSGVALQTIGAIHISQDIAGNPPITRFMVGRDWVINQNTPATIDPIQNRPIFAWLNANTIKMWMDSRGDVRIGENLATGGTGPFNRANNRLEITPFTNNPYFDPNGNPIGNPNIGPSSAGPFNFGSCSGLRFTMLTSRDLVIAPNATNEIDPSKVLSVDVNGDVIAIYPAIGAVCTNTLQLAGQAFTANRAINQGTFNMEWRGQGRNGFGTNGCVVGNRVEITGLNSFSATPGGNSGLRFSLMTSTTAAITNTTNKVLSVNANGDVILVTDQTGTVAAGAIAAQNGLTLVGTNTVELGGTLIRPVTTIDFNGNELDYTNGSPTKLYVRGANGGTYAKAVGPPPFGTPETSFYEDVTATTPNSAFGRELNVAAASPTVGNFFLVGSRVIVNAAPVSSVAISGDVVGNWSRSQNTGSSAKGNFAFKAEALGAGPASINAGYISSATGSLRNYGFYAELVNTFAAQEDIGIKSLMQANALTTNVIGGDFNTLRGVNAYGVRAFAQGGTSTNYGVFAKVPAGVSGSLNYGIYAEAPTTFTTSGPNYAGYFNGDVVKTGADNFSSDQNLKQNIDTITNAIGIIKLLKPKTFDYKQSSYPSMSLPGGKQYGLIAQDVQSILPELVNTISHPAQLDSLGNVITPGFNYLGLEYQQLIPFLIKGMQQQQRTIEKQDSVIQVVQSQIAALTSSVTSCCSSSVVRTTSADEQNQLSVNLSDKDIIVLNQNVPNPFAEQTTITYNVPEKYGYAQMIFSTIDGRILKTVDITKKGRGTLNVFSNDLSSGMYTYSLVVDGKVMDTKKMVKSE